MNVAIFFKEIIESCEDEVNRRYEDPTFGGVLPHGRLAWREFENFIKEKYGYIGSYRILYIIMRYMHDGGSFKFRWNGLINFIDKEYKI